MPEAGRWYFIELSWNDDNGLKVYQDLKMVGHVEFFDFADGDEGNSNLMIGRANTEMKTKQYVKAALDEVRTAFYIIAQHGEYCYWFAELFSVVVSFGWYTHMTNMHQEFMKTLLYCKY